MPSLNRTAQPTLIRRSEGCSNRQWEAQSHGYAYKLLSRGPTSVPPGHKYMLIAHVKHYSNSLDPQTLEPTVKQLNSLYTKRCSLRPQAGTGSLWGACVDGSLPAHGEASADRSGDCSMGLCSPDRPCSSRPWSTYKSSEIIS